MRWTAILIVVLGLALAFTGCREITGDLHDVYTVTFDPLGGEVSGKRILEKQTDVYGRIRPLPTPKKGEWLYKCDLPYTDENGEDMGWGTHTWSGVCEIYNCPSFTNYDHVNDFEAVLGFNGAPVIDPITGQPSFVPKYNGWAFKPDLSSLVFLGWRTAGRTMVTENTVFSANTHLIAIWQPVSGIPPAPNSVAAKLNELYKYADEKYTPNKWDILMGDDEQIFPQVLYFGGDPIEITIKGTFPEFWWMPGEKRKSPTILELASTGPLFTVRDGVTLILDNVQIYGYTNRNEISLFIIEDGGKVVIDDDYYTKDDNGDDLKCSITITESYTFSHIYGGAFTVLPGGKLEMKGGRIWQNMLRHPRVNRNVSMGGAAVWVRGGLFEMSGGVIDENIAFGGGGAVRVSHGGIFNMTEHHKNAELPYDLKDPDIDPVIFDNSAYAGGGVYISGGEEGFTQISVFNMEGGSIEDNFAALWGGGVSVAQMGRFILNGGVLTLNESYDGGAVDNEGIFHFLSGAIWGNDSAGGGTGGVSNWRITEMYDGLIAFNEGGFGGGVRNFDDFTMFDGAILGNIGNGGPAGGVLNYGNFYMHGGAINGNVSNTSQGGGIFHGTSGDPDVGYFVITSGQIFNNRDLTTYHIFPTAGLPGEMGNIRRNNVSNRLSFVLARPGFFSFNLSDRPDGWDVWHDYIPVYQGAPGNLINPDAAGTPVTGWQGVYWFTPPMPTGPRPEGWQTRIDVTVGRPRIEVYTKDNPSSSRQIMYDTSLEAIKDSATEGAYPPIGGTWFPSRLPTANVMRDSDDDGYLWLFTLGYIIPIPWYPISIWPVPPALDWYNFEGYLPDMEEAWPYWPQQYGGDIPSTLPPLQQPSNYQMPRPSARSQGNSMPQQITDINSILKNYPMAERLLQKYPNLVEQKKMKLHEGPEWPVTQIEVQLENRKAMYVNPRGEKRLLDIMDRLTNEDDGDGPSPFGN